MKRYANILLFIILFFVTSGNCLVFGQSRLDSVRHLREVVVTERTRISEIRSSAPLQILTQEKLIKLNALQLSDAVKFFSGVSVKDYGGVGGLKTVSVRSLGANHTAVSYDGIRLNDAQTGQIDIGRFSLDNVDVISLNSGQSDNIFQPAQLFAAGSALNIRTIRPAFEKDEQTHGKISLKGGSFGLINPSAYLAQKISNKFSVSLSTEMLYANGKYPYILDYGIIGKDSASNEIRQNTDVRNFRLESAVFGQLSEKESIEASVYYYQSERGLPGATVFYNKDNFSSQRLSDKTFFTRVRYEKEFSQAWVIQANGKYNRGTLRYVDPTYLTPEGKDESNYLQHEIYGSFSALYRSLRNVSFSASTDFSYTKLDADSYNFSYPTRFTWLSVLASKYVNEYVLATASLLSTVVNEQVETGKAGKNYRQLSPYMSFSVKPFKSADFRIRAFYKHIFRMPTFNDLYYSRIGNPDLKPEKTNQFNLGITFNHRFSDVMPLASITIDAYHNDVTDKIVAYPTKNIFVWTMLNFGKVNIDGIDFTAETAIYPWRKTGLAMTYTHTYQRALNVTDPAGREYKHQMPYTPRVSGSGRVSLETPWVKLAYTMLWSGHRYILQNYSANRIEGYVEQSISASQDFKITKLQKITATVEVLNLGGENYAIVRYFPMPGRSWRATVSYRF